MVEAQQPEATLTAEPVRPVIVVGYSSKPEGRAALARALEEARLRNAELAVVHTSPEVEVADLRT